MVRLSVLRWSVATLALVGARPALAGAIQFTGNVAADFPLTNPTVHVINVEPSATSVGPSEFMVQNGWVSGWAIKDVRLSYDAATDTLSVGFETFTNGSGKPAIVGDADGNGNPGAASAQMAAAGGVDEPSLGGHKSVVVEFAADKQPGQEIPGNPVLIAGVPAIKTAADTGLDHFAVAQPINSTLGLGYNFGNAIPGVTGALAFDPSAAQPGFEFTISHFSKSGLDPSQALWVKAYAGSPDDVVVGEAGVDFTRIPVLSEQQVVPEPATILGWSVVVGAATLLRRQRRRRASV